jgi:hypothetical protein
MSGDASDPPDQHFIGGSPNGLRYYGAFTMHRRRVPQGVISRPLAVGVLHRARQARPEDLAHAKEIVATAQGRAEPSARREVGALSSGCLRGLDRPKSD